MPKEALKKFQWSSGIMPMAGNPGKTQVDTDTVRKTDRIVMGL